MCSSSEAGSYLRLVDFVYHSTLGLRVIRKKKRPARPHHAQLTFSYEVGSGYLVGPYGRQTRRTLPTTRTRPQLGTMSVAHESLASAVRGRYAVERSLTFSLNQSLTHSDTLPFASPLSHLSPAVRGRYAVERTWLI